MLTIRNPVLLACLLAAAVGCGGRETGSDAASTGSAGERFDVGGHRLHLMSRGSGSPAIVVDTGFGNRAETWKEIQEALAPKTRVVLYDRAGYGRSDPGPLPRDADRVVEELARLLDAAGIPPPYVLVGHSLGGMHVQHFAARYPQRTAALVLLDPPPPPAEISLRYPGLYALMDSVTRELETLAHALESSDDPDDRARAPLQRTLASEHRMMIDRNGAIQAADSIDPEIPVVAIASEVPNPAFGDSASSFQSFWIKNTWSLAQDCSNGRFVLATGSTHHLHRDAPGLIIDVIEDLLEEITAPPGG